MISNILGGISQKDSTQVQFTLWIEVIENFSAILVHSYLTHRKRVNSYQS